MYIKTIEEKTVEATERCREYIKRLERVTGKKQTALNALAYLAEYHADIGAKNIFNILSHFVYKEELITE